MKFIVNRAEGEIRSFSAPGKYIVTVASAKEAPLDRNGNSATLVTFRGEGGEIISDRYQAKETQFWRLNQLVAASNVEISDGEEFDFTRPGSLTKFLERFVGQRCEVTLSNETYTGRDGQPVTTLRVRGLAKAPTQIDEAF